MFYRAQDTELDRIVALRFHAAVRFRDEVGRTESIPYIVTQFVVTLSDVLSSRRFEFRDAAELIRSAAEIVHHAHVAGVAVTIRSLVQGS